MTGYLVEEQNVPQLVDAIERFLSLGKEERAQMGQNGRKKVENEFDRKKVTQIYMDTIHVLLENK